MSLNLARALNSTSNIITIMAWDTVNKKPRTGLTYSTSGLVVYSGLNGAAPSSIGTLTTMTEGTFTSLGFVEMANMPGFYQVGTPNTLWDDAVGELLIGARITSDDTIVFSPQTIPILPASAYASQVDANVTQWNGSAVATPNTNGVPKVDVTHILGTAGATTELSAIPSATASFWDRISFLFMRGRNKMTQTSSTTTLYKDDGTTSVGTSTVSDDGTTFTRGKAS